MTRIHIQTRDGPKPINIRWGLVALVPVVLILIVVVSSSYYSVNAGEQGIVQRFGKYVRQTGPGLHFKFPWGIEKVTIVNVEYRYKEEFGFRTEKAGITTRYDTRRRPEYELVSLMLTGDLNCAVVQWSVQYHIKDPVSYLFKVRNAERTLRDMCESIMREIVGDRSVTEVLTRGREEINFEVKRQLQDVLDLYNSGIKITQVICQSVLPPQDVMASFNEVNEAQQEMERIQNQAQAEYNKVIPKARGQAQKVINEAEGYRAERVNRAMGDVARFKNILAEYDKARDITRKRLYLETLQKVLPKIKRKVILDAEARSILPLLNLDREGRSK
jgi:membrane protease subunit HflK